MEQLSTAHRVARFALFEVDLDSGELRKNGVKLKIQEHPFQILVRCDRPALLASRVFAIDHTVEARIHADGLGLLVATRDPACLYRLLNRAAVEDKLRIETVQPADDDVQSLYDYLIGNEGGQQ